MHHLAQFSITETGNILEDEKFPRGIIQSVEGFPYESSSLFPDGMMIGAGIILLFTAHVIPIQVSGYREYPG